MVQGPKPLADSSVCHPLLPANPTHPNLSPLSLPPGPVKVPGPVKAMHMGRQRGGETFLFYEPA